MNDLCADIGYKSINHYGEQLCGDHVDIVEQGDNSTVIVLADGLLGEVTPDMARAVGQSAAFRILIPSDRCETWVAGVSPVGMSALVEDALQKLGALLARGD